MEHLHDADKAGSAVPENGEGFEAGRDESLKTQQITRPNCSTEPLAAQADGANRRYFPARFDGFSATMREARAVIGIVGVHADQVMARGEGGEFAVTCVPTTAKEGNGGLRPIDAGFLLFRGRVACLMVLRATSYARSSEELAELLIRELECSFGGGWISVVVVAGVTHG